MAKHLALAVGLCLALAYDVRSDDVDPEPPGSSAKALRELKGTWTVTRAVFGKREAKAPPGMTYCFDDDRLVRVMPFGKGDNKQTFKVKLDLSKKPHRITMTPENGGAVQSAIFKIEKGELSVATARGKNARAPADFTGDDVSVMVMTKDK
jgi:uncharacterized protein (TIGR03067 family)